MILQTTNSSTLHSWGTVTDWRGLSGNHIVDPQVWLSCGHLYDVVYGRGFLPDADAETFEEMMALCDHPAAPAANSQRDCQSGKSPKSN
jgi:hypothetical protein